MSNNLKYYLLGFFYADASISKYRLSISLGIKDEAFLQKIADIFNVKLYRRIVKSFNCKYYNYVQISICRKDRVDQWRQLGIIENKTTLCRSSSIFDNIPEEYKVDFVRGYFDGDGTIIKLKNGTHHFSIVSVNYNLLKSIKKFIENKVDFKLNLKKENNVFRLNKKGNISLEKLFPILYYNNCFCLDRKFNIFSKIRSVKFKFYYYHKNSKKWRVKIDKTKDHHFNSEQECIEFIKKYKNEKLINEMAS